MSAIETMRRIGRPIAYHPALAKHVGGVNAAIFLCQLIYWDGKADDDLGVYKTADEWELETGLSYREQAGARKKLRDLGLLVETNLRLKHRIYYKLDNDAFNSLFESVSSGENVETRESTNVQLANDENAIGGEPKAQLGGDPKRSSLITTKTTAEITTETTSSGKPAEPDSCQFAQFWLTYPNTPRRVAKAKCFDIWKKNKLNDVADEIIGHVWAMKRTKQWKDGYEPAPLTYLNQRRWEDGLPDPSLERATHVRGGEKPTAFDQGMAAAERAKTMIFGDNHAS